jgi:hypothetical protein
MEVAKSFEKKIWFTFFNWASEVSKKEEKYEERQTKSYLRRMKVKKFIHIADQKEILNGEGKKKRKKERKYNLYVS